MMIFWYMYDTKIKNGTVIMLYISSNIITLHGMEWCKHILSLNMGLFRLNGLESYVFGVFVAQNYSFPPMPSARHSPVL